MAEKVGQPVSYVDDLHHHTAKYLFDFQFTLERLCERRGNSGLDHVRPSDSVFIVTIKDNEVDTRAERVISPTPDSTSDCKFEPQSSFHLVSPPMARW